MTQPEALRLADALTEAAGDYWQFDKSLGYGAAAELRRLSAVEAQRDALLEALKDATKTIEHSAIFLQRLSEHAPPSRRQKERSDDQR